MSDRRLRCARPGCDEPAVRKYCSRSCANKHQGELRRQEKLSGGGSRELDIQFVRSGAIPRELEDVMLRKFGHNAVNEVLREMEEHRTQEDVELAAIPRPLRVQQPLFPYYDKPLAINPRSPMKPPTAEDIEPDGNIQWYYGDAYSEMRRADDIPLDDIELMRRSGPCVLAARMKKAPIISALSGERKWTVNSPDRKLKEVATANLKNLFLYHLNDLLTVMDYGTLFGSLVWAQRTAEQIGVEAKGVGSGSEWYVVDKLQAAHPSSVERILRDGQMKFLGFRHHRKRMKPQYKNILSPQALVLTYNAQFGSLYGQSLFDPAYNSWFWYEVVMRSCLRYLERMGVPVAVCRAPSRGYTVRPDGTEVPNAEYALLVAGYAAHHSALYIPSDVDPQTNQQLWQLEYLEADQRGEQFIQILRFLSTQITRAMIVGDLAASQPQGEGGSYNLGSVHDKNTQVDNDQIFQNLLGQINKYWMPRYAQFNRDYNNPPAISLAAAVLDPLERETLMKLFATAGNVKIGDGTPLDWIDWERAFQGVYAPVLSEEERKAMREQMTDEKVEVQKKFQEAQPKPQPGQDGSRNGNNDPRERDRAQSIKNMAGWIADGNLVPVLLTADMVSGLVRPVQEEIDLSGYTLVGENGEEIELGLIDEIAKRTRRALSSLRGPKRTPGARGVPKSGGRRTTKDGEPVENPEFEEKHPRDAGGRFAKKGEGEGASEEDEQGGLLHEVIGQYAEELAPLYKRFEENIADEFPGGREQYESMRKSGFDELSVPDKLEVIAFLHDAQSFGDDWPGRDDSRGRKGEIKIGEMTYVAAGEGISVDDMARFIIQDKKIRRGLRDEGIDIVDVTSVSLVDTGDRDALEKYIKNDVGKAGPIAGAFNRGISEEMIRGTAGGFITYDEVTILGTLRGDQKYQIVMGDQLLNDNLGFEHYLTHEYFHAREREDTLRASAYEEAFTEMANKLYMYDKHGSWAITGYDDYIDAMVSNAYRSGMTKDEFREFVFDTHGLGGESDLKAAYNNLVTVPRSSMIEVRIEREKSSSYNVVNPDLLRWYPDIYPEDVRRIAYERLGWLTDKQREDGV